MTDLNGLNYTAQQRADLYSEIASGAETGWDFTSRFSKDPFATVGNTTNLQPLMRALNVRGTAPVDLNSILYDAFIQLAHLYDISIGTSSAASVTTSPPTFADSLGTNMAKRGEPFQAERITQQAAFAANQHRANAALRKAAILDLMWDSQKMAFYDFNLTSNARGTFFSAAHFYPMWLDIWPDEVARGGSGAEQVAQKMFAPVGLVLSRYNGTFPSTFLKTGAQWDFPNAWPPHLYIIIKGLANIPSNLSTQAYPRLGSETTSFSLLPPGQLGLSESQLTLQPLASGQSASTDINYDVSGTWSSGGTPRSGETWSQALIRGMANRYIGSVFCSWYSTGGSIPGLLNQLTSRELQATFSTPESTGHMYEKFNALDGDSAESGGEHTVQDGFGWTNGVALWVASKYGTILDAPKCPTIDITPVPLATRGLGKRSTRFIGKRV
ncbi:hypothetical protein FRB93_006401 [Tulasnella sp. JGI-2019a]|nr:hypothetical protein FRB93_006401 [Tulasnella sp. JGI-2019a]